MDNIDLKRIKKHYGENFAKLCRELFPTILETPGALSKIIFERFDTSPTLYEDVLKMKYDFKTFVFGFYNNQQVKTKKEDRKTAEQLLSEAGYILFPECKQESDIQKFRKYYTKAEELCTFRLHRLDTCRVWFAVKKDVDKIKRKDFENPDRQDEYGTSVLSIQFTKEKDSTLSIKNRYNHMVSNPDATFGNNLDNIIPGLTDAFCREYGINLTYKFSHMLSLDGYVSGSDGRFYKSNVCDFTANRCFCANNVVVDVRNGRVINYDKSRYILADNYLIDLVNKKITGSIACIDDEFVSSIGEIKSIHVSLDQNKNRVIDITPTTGEDVKIVVNKSNQIIEYTNKNITKLKNDFMYFCKSIKKLDLPNLERVGKCFAYYNRKLTDLNLPNLRSAGDSFLDFNEELTSINLPKLDGVGGHFLQRNEKLKELNLPNLRIAGNDFLTDNTSIEEVDLPKLERVGYGFLTSNSNIKKLDLPNLIEAGDSFFQNSRDLTELNLPKLVKVGSAFLYFNEKLTEINLPKLKSIGRDFLAWNHSLKKIYLPKLEWREARNILSNNPDLAKEKGITL